MSRDNLRTHVRALEGERHHVLSPAHLQAAHDYIEAQWRRLEFDIALDEFSYMGERFVNLIGRPVPVPPGPSLIIGAHLDTVPGTPGADDNASGLAVMVEAARLLTARSLPVPLEFIAFTLEELGMVGSDHYAQTLRESQTPVLGMLSLEMVGFTESKGDQRYPWFLQGRFPRVGTYLGLAGNGRSRRLLKTVAEAMRTVPGLPIASLTLPANGWLFPEARLSDHSPFWDRGYPALLVTDTSFFRNPHYHRSSDTLETLDLAFMEHVCRGLVAAVEVLAQSRPF